LFLAEQYAVLHLPLVPIEKEIFASYLLRELRRDGGVTDICGSMGYGIGMQNSSSSRSNELQTNEVM